MLRSLFCVSCVTASLALAAHFEASVVQAGPASGAQSSRYRSGASYSYPAPAIVVAPATTGEPLLYSFYAPPARTAATSEEESESGQNAAAKIELTVPAGAEVWFDGKATNQTGSARAFDTPPLQPGKTFSYDLRVRWTAPGGIVVDVTRPIQVRAGRQTVVGFKQ
jgi:uncharacterized protein (TIGR03000 family)